MRKLTPVSMKIPSARVTWGFVPAQANEQAKSSRARIVVTVLQTLIFMAGSDDEIYIIFQSIVKTNHQLCIINTHT